MPESNCPGVETTRVVSQQSTASDQFEQVVAGADQRPLAVDLFQAPQQELPETPALLDLAEDRLHAQVMGLVNYLRRVVTGVGGYFPGNYTGVAYGLLHHRRSLLLVRGQVGGPGRHDDLMGMVHHGLTVVGLQEVPAARPRHDAGFSIGEVALGLVLGHPRMGLTFDLGLFRRRLGLASNAAMASLVFSNRPSRKASFSGNSSPRLSFPYRRSSSSSTSWARRSNSATSAANCASFSFVRL